MRNSNFDYEKDEIVFFGVHALLLRWSYQSYFSYMETPRPNYGFMYLLCDGAFVEYKDGSVDVFKKGDVLYIPQGLYYNVKFSGDMEPLEALLINFSAAGYVPKCEKIKNVIENASPAYLDSFLKIVNLYTNTKNYKFAIMKEFYNLLENISLHIDNKNEENGNFKVISNAVNYINSNINQELSIPYLAKLCLLSESAFRKKFKAYMNKTPVEYILEIKLEKAEELLKKTDIPISEIVSQLNFYDSAYFNKLCKKRYGLSPSMIRENKKPSAV